MHQGDTELVYGCLWVVCAGNSLLLPALWERHSGCEESSRHVHSHTMGHLEWMFETFGLRRPL